MLRMTPGVPVYLALGPTDLRNNIDGLSIIVERIFHLDPFLRKFVEALKVVPPKEREHTSANMAIQKIAELFHIDHQFADVEPEERKKTYGRID